MKTRKAFSYACALALIANSFASVSVMAQEKKQEKSTQNREGRFVIQQSDGKVVTVQTGDGQTATFNVRMPEPGGGAFPLGEGFSSVWVNAGSDQGGDSTFQFFSQQMSFENRLVSGAPFSAETLSETVQTLADGNRIVQRSEGRIYRDSQGRTRQERTFRMGGSGAERQTINIFDPVGNMSYMLDPAARTAHKMPTFMRVPPPPPPSPVPEPLPGTAAAPTAGKKIDVSGGVLQGGAIKKVQPQYPAVAKAARAEGAVQVRVTVSEDGGVIDAQTVSGHPLLRDAAVEAARQWQFKPTEVAGAPVKAQGILTFNFTLSDKEEIGGAMSQMPVPAAATYKKESLGKRAIESVECEGTRVVTTIPAGAIGNENPIETIRESWYSPDLKMTVMSKQTDPRFGESTYRVTNIVRSEPDASLFQVPNDYTVKEPNNRFEFNNMEYKMRKPQNEK